MGHDPASIGHNGGPPLDQPAASDRLYWYWSRARKAAFKAPNRWVMMRRLERAEALGMSYEAYTARQLDTGVWL